MKQLSKSVTIDLIIIISILIACLKFTSGLENVLDIGLFDESGYLYSGVQIRNAGLPSAANAPLYALWYFLLSLLQPNRISLYYLSYKLTIVFIPVLTYILIRRYRAPLSISLIASWVLLISRANALTWPRVSHFALLLILATFIFIGPGRPLVWGSLLASIGSLLASYVRPEYFLAYLLFALLFIFLFLRRYKEFIKQYLLGIFAYGLFSVLLLNGLGLPIVGDRSMVAFGQHFSLNWVLRNGSDIDPWINWTEIVSQNFGPVHNVPEAFLSNPSAFLMHIGDNLKYFMLSIPTFFLPAHLPLNRTLAIVIILLSIGVPITYLIIFHFQRLMIIAEDFRKGFQSGKDDFILTGIFLLPPFLSMIIIYPRAHYLLIFGVLAAITMIILFTNSLGKQEQVNMKNLLVLSILMILVTPRFDQNLEGLQKPNLNTIRFIQSLEIDEPVNLLGSDGGYNIYLGRNFHPIGVNEKNTNFNVFRTDHKINLIILSDTLLNSSRFKNDPEWQDFLVNSRQLGYVQIEIPNSDRRIIIQEKLLHE